MDILKKRDQALALHFVLEHTGELPVQQLQQKRIQKQLCTRALPAQTSFLVL